MRATVWKSTLGWWVEWCPDGHYNPARPLPLRLLTTCPGDHFPTHAEALSHALRMVGLAPEGER